MHIWTPGLVGRTACDGDVLLQQGDHPDTADLRAVRGLRVIVIGRGHGGFDEAERWARAMCTAGAQHVGLAFKVPADEGGIDGPVWLRLYGENIA